MFEEMIGFAFGGFYGGSIGSILSYWESIGFFSYVLPFLLIFALIFGILTRVDLFKSNKAINGILALTVSLLSLQFEFVPLFFSQIFPRLGIGLALILVAFILLGLFIPNDQSNKYVGWVGFFFGLIIFVVVVAQSFLWSGDSWGWYFWDGWPKLIAIAVVLGAVGLVWNSVEPTPNRNLPPYPVPTWRAA